ncbi:hypothetical protein GUITHDRAFT_150955 [Guillardia theta CCMP2712]|uniref:Uncharacterized protein n=1 Tax=Guillardia theta (strain CCMP2712) TaxID=905079 RepID=L1JT86_GUITC|nr:hypothetical protein GUITHDRAFT_150955 [Guillardia theta CCMP2712]EKX51657.1 hypothetical protein GUITHDRAFT_150955 [Guillardia theta CCMP2712]|eukprot:XP_005838637.1 hypothetical protein GUITHDRAFT_150955 [Guillardia theta CCMP2712]
MSTASAKLRARATCDHTTRAISLDSWRESPPPASVLALPEKAVSKQRAMKRHSRVGDSSRTLAASYYMAFTL